jgi:hypothetical protein
MFWLFAYNQVLARQLPHICAGMPPEYPPREIKVMDMYENQTPEALLQQREQKA